MSEVVKSRDRRRLPKWGLPAAALATALAVPFIGAQPALADALDDTVTIDSVTVGPDRLVTVNWTLGAGVDTSATATDVDVAITDPDGVTVADEGTCDNDSSYVSVGTGSTCSFTAGAADGLYSIEVTPVNVGSTTDPSSESDTETVTVAAPTGSIAASSLTAVADGATVSVDWSNTGITDWGTTAGQDIDVAVTGGTVTGNTCTSVTYTSTSCEFTATASSAATYTVTLTPTNNAGDGTPTSKNVLVSAPASAPTGTVSDLSAVADGATVNVTWGASGITWGSGTGQGLLTSVTTAGGGVLGTNTCTGTLAKTATSCHFTATHTGTFTVSVTPTSSIGNGTAASDAVVVSAVAPSGTLATSGVNAAASGADVTVTWTPGDITDWGAGEASTHKFDVTIDPDTIEDDGTCVTGMAKTANTCTFTATAADTYTVTVTPRNSAGSGVSEDDTATVSASNPTSSAPDLLLATAVDGAQVHVTWDAAGVTSWGLFAEHPGFELHTNSQSVGENDCGMDADGTAADRLPSTTEGCTFTTTTAGAYTVTLTPVNDNGSGTAATDTATTTASVPVQAPVPAASTPDDDGVITVHWTAIGNSDWGSGADRSIDVEVGPTSSATSAGAGIAGGTCSADMPEDTTECTFTPSSAGSYTVTLTPKTEEGRGAPQTLSVAVAGTAPTGAVSDLAATVEGTTVSVTWDGSSVVWGTGTSRVYKVAVTGGDVGASTCTMTLASTAESCEFTALDEATYTITVTPSNSEGDADAADVEAEVESLAPATPADVEVTAGASELMVSWTEGESTGIDVTYYTATANPGGMTCSTANADTTGCTIAGLTPGVPYLVTVVAHGAAGADSAPSDSKAGTPMGADLTGPTVRNASGQLQVFARAGNGSVVTSVQDENGDWGAWVSLGGGIIGEPVVFRSANGQLHLLAIGLNRAVWQRQQTSASSNSWSAWSSASGGDVRSIAVALNSSGEAVVVSRTGGGSVWTISQTAANSTSWSTWLGLGGGVVNDPRLVTNSDGDLEVIAVGLDNALWHRVQTGDTWSDWARVSSASSAIAA